jgi:hypothetical protein
MNLISPSRSAIFAALGAARKIVRSKIEAKKLADKGGLGERCSFLGHDYFIGKI